MPKGFGIIHKQREYTNEFTDPENIYSTQIRAVLYVLKFQPTSTRLHWHAELYTFTRVTNFINKMNLIFQFISNFDEFILK